MKARVFVCLMVLFAASSCFAAVSADLKLPLPEIETLPNGLELVWFVADRLPVVDMEMDFRSGSKDDPRGKSGTAELLSAVLDRGAGGLTADELARRVESLGASRFASVDDDFFKVGMHGLAPDANTLLELLSKIVLAPALPDSEIEKEKARMVDGWSRVSEYGESLVELVYRRALTQGTEYARGDFLSAHEFAHVSRADLVAFHERNFTPKNAVLMVVGRVDRAAFRARIEALFGNWQGDAPSAHRVIYRTPSLEKKAGGVMLIDRPDLTQAQVRIGFRAPLVNDPRHYPLTVANALLGEYFHSRLNTLIRDKLGLTYGIESEFSYNRDIATFTISSATRNESVGQLIRKTLDVLRDLRKTPVPAGEVEMAKDYLIGGFPLSTATLESVANRWMVCHLFDLPPDRLNEYVRKVGAVTPADVISAVSRSFDLDHLTIAVAGDSKAIEPKLKAAGFKIAKISSRKLLD